MPRSSDELIIPIPHEYSKSKYNILIDGVDRRADVLKATFEKTLAPDVGVFKVVLDNNNQAYTDKFIGGEEVEFQYDFSSGTTRVFLGEVEEVKDMFNEGGQQLEIIGSHVTGGLLDRVVTASYDGSTSADNIIKDLINTFSPSGFTTANVQVSDTFPKIAFNAVPLWTAIGDVLASVGDFDLYVDDDKDLHFFKEGTQLNDDEHITFDDSLLELESLGKDLLDIRNVVRVYGEQEGLPVVYTAEDLASQSAHGVREHVIQNTDISTEEEAETIGEAVLKIRKDNFDVGGGSCLLLPGLFPGGFTYIISSPHRIIGRFRIVKFTHIVPDEITKFEVEDVRT